jgi:hypothetical protein
LQLASLASRPPLGLRIVFLCYFSAAGVEVRLKDKFAHNSSSVRVGAGQGAGDMALFAATKEPFLRSFLTLANGLPSHDTFSRLFRNLDPDQFCDLFQRFMAQFSEQLQGVVAIDGKVLRRSFALRLSRSPEFAAWLPIPVVACLHKMRIIAPDAIHGKTHSNELPKAESAARSLLVCSHGVCLAHRRAALLHRHR